MCTFGGSPPTHPDWGKGSATRVGIPPKHLPQRWKNLNRLPCAHVRLRVSKQVGAQVPPPKYQSGQGPRALASVVTLSSALWAARLSTVAAQGQTSSIGTSFLLPFFISIMKYFLHQKEG